MSSFQKKVEQVMSSEDSGHFTPFFAALLYFLSLVYSAVVFLRWDLYRRGVLSAKRLPCQVISVGNLTVGGTGKTPVAIYVARYVKRLGYKVAVLTRGYKGERERSGAVVSDGQSISLGPHQAGDEAYCMACKLDGVPVLVGRNRFKSGIHAINAFGADVLVLDDGFQHMQLGRDIDLVLFDACRPLGNGHVIPRGILREPVRHISRADAFVVTRCLPGGNVGLGRELKRFEKERPSFFCTHLPDALIEDEKESTDRPLSLPRRFGLNMVQGKKVVAFSGIGNNEDFRSTVEMLGCHICAFLAFSDHYRYTQSDAAQIQTLAAKLHADHILTTEKDYVRILQFGPWPIRLFAVSIGISFTDGGGAFENYVANRLAKQ